MFEHITLKSLYETRRVLTLTAADLLFFLTPRYGDFVITQVAAQLNEAVAKLRAVSASCGPTSPPGSSMGQRRSGLQDTLRGCSSL